MKVSDYLIEVAYIAPSEIKGDEGECYLSKFDDSYVTRIGMEENIKYLADREITKELTHGVGYSPKEEKWYGWSHRAINGFKIGSTCKKGDCHYRASNIKEEIRAAERFWDDERHIYTKAKLNRDGKIWVEWEYNNKVPNEKLKGTINGCSWSYDMTNFGNGEWIAKTMEDAKQMAVDFNEGVS